MNIPQGMWLPCQTDPELFFGPDGEGVRNRAVRVLLAKALCATCPLIAACREEARRNGEDGVWGGEDEKDRARARKKAGVSRPRVPARCGTEAGARRHYRAGEKPCGPCLTAARAAMANRRPSRAKVPAECGTRPGYQRHRRNGEPACEPCRIANTQADRRLRTTGSTLAAA